MLSKKTLLKYRARHLKTGKVVEMEFYSLKQAKYFNPCLVEWERVE